MTTSRLATLVAFVTLGIATVFLLPKGGKQPLGVRPELPDFVGIWNGHDAKIEDKERETLGESSGTTILRKAYRNLDGYEITVSLIISGRDMSRSIHRLERCLDAQGWIPRESDDAAISLPKRGFFPARHLLSTRSEKAPGGGIVHELDAYYWFVGERDICSGHWTRMAIDNRDRLFRGVSQRWAYILVTAPVPTAKDPKDDEAVRKWSDHAMREFIQMLAPKIHLDTVRYD